APHHQVSVQQEPLGLLDSGDRHVHQQSGHLLPHSHDRLMDSGEWWITVPGHERVVESHKCQVLGDLQAPGAKDPHATDRHHVRGHEHRVGVGSAVQKLLHSLCTTLGTEVTLDAKTLVDLDPGLLHGLPVPAESFHTGVHVERAGDGGDPAATDVQKTLGRRTPAPDVADLDV